MSNIGIGKDKSIPIGESSTTNAIKRMMDSRTGNAFGTGFMTSHSFRHTASTMLNELEYGITSGCCGELTKWIKHTDVLWFAPQC